MNRWDAQQIAHAAGAQLLRAPPIGSLEPGRATIDSREAGPGALFIGLAGDRVHGGSFAVPALAAGAWGVLTAPEHAEAAVSSESGAVLSADDPLLALQRLATAWRRP